MMRALADKLPVSQPIGDGFVTSQIRSEINRDRMMLVCAIYNLNGIMQCNPRFRYGFAYSIPTDSIFGSMAESRSGKLGYGFIALRLNQKP